MTLCTTLSPKDLRRVSLCESALRKAFLSGESSLGNGDPTRSTLNSSISNETVSVGRTRVVTLTDNVLENIVSSYLCFQCCWSW